MNFPNFFTPFTIQEEDKNHGLILKIEKNVGGAKIFLSKLKIGRVYDKDNDI